LLTSSGGLAVTVTAITGIAWVTGDARIWRVAAQPSKTGIWRSIRILSGLFGLRRRYPRRAVGGFDHLIAPADEPPPQQVPIARIVVYHQDFRHRVHRIQQ